MSLVLDHVTLSIGRRRLLSLHAAIGPGAIVTLMGPSGSGKSTLLAAIAGTLDPAFSLAGRILLNDAPIDRLPPEKRRVGILFQDDLLFPHMSVGGNLAFGLRGRHDRRGRIARALEEAGLGGFADRDPATLSGGQRARVALMRLILSEPRALLLDEPFSSLDAALRGEIRAFVFAKARRQHLPVLLVTHDQADAQAAGGPIIPIGPGRSGMDIAFA